MYVFRFLCFFVFWRYSFYSQSLNLRKTLCREYGYVLLPENSFGNQLLLLLLLLLLFLFWRMCSVVCYFCLNMLEYWRILFSVWKTWNQTLCTSFWIVKLWKVLNYFSDWAHIMKIVFMNCRKRMDLSFFDQVMEEFNKKKNWNEYPGICWCRGSSHRTFFNFFNKENRKWVTVNYRITTMVLI